LPIPCRFEAFAEVDGGGFDLSVGVGAVGLRVDVDLLVFGEIEILAFEEEVVESAARDLNGRDCEGETMCEWGSRSVRVRCG
jgi:hypothetical protein